MGPPKSAFIRECAFLLTERNEQTHDTETSLGYYASEPYQYESGYQSDNGVGIAEETFGFVFEKSILCNVWYVRIIPARLRVGSQGPFAQRW